MNDAPTYLKCGLTLRRDGVPARTTRDVFHFDVGHPQWTLGTNTWHRIVVFGDVLANPLFEIVLEVFFSLSVPSASRWSTLM